VLLGPGLKIDDNMLIACLANSVSASESQLIKDSLKVNSGELHMTSEFAKMPE